MKTCGFYSLHIKKLLKLFFPLTDLDVLELFLSKLGQRGSVLRTIQFWKKKKPKATLSWKSEEVQQN